MSTNVESPAPPLAVPGPSIVPGQFTQLLEAITSSQTRMERWFAEFRDEVRQGQEEAATKALKRAKFDKPYAYRKKGNEEQAVFNSCLDETVAEAETELVAASPGAPTSATAITKAHECLKKGRQLLAERQKLIRIVDRSALGWGVVAEYTVDELADDSGYEKRLEKAERAAEHKASKRKRKRRMTTVAVIPKAK